MKEIFDNLKDHEWRKMNETNDVLSVSEVKIKIRKAYNDRMKKLAKTEKEELQKASKQEKAIGRVHPSRYMMDGCCKSITQLKKGCQFCRIPLLPKIIAMTAHFWSNYS